MPRWEHGSKDRLLNASIELFDEQGFENTSVIEIADRARVTTRTFFRYFSDKREVLFAGSDVLRAALVEKILQAPDVAEPLQIVTGVLAQFNWESLGPKGTQRKRQAVILANPELLERDLIKHHCIAVALSEALAQRGAKKDVARLAAHVGVQIFSIAYQRWLGADSKANLATSSESVMSLLPTIVPPKALRADAAGAKRRRKVKRARS